MLAQIQDNTHKAYVALQSYVTSPANIPIPGVVHTDRPKLTRDQMAARYLKSVEGNPDIDINKVGERQQQKTPKMVQKSASASETLKALGYEQSPEKQTITMERSVESVRRTCRQTVKEYIEDPSLTILRRQIQIEFVGESNPNDVCWADIPEFVVCKNPDSYREFWANTPLREKVLDYSHSEAMHGNYADDFAPCDFYPDLCPTLETSPEEINLQISQTIREYPRTRVYLNQTQLDDFLKWREDNGETEKLNYTLVSDKPASASIPSDNTPQQENHKPASAGDNDTILLAMAGSVCIGTLTVVTAVSIAMNCQQGCCKPTAYSDKSDSSSESDVIVTLSDNSDSSSESDVIVSPPDVNSDKKEKQRSKNDLTNHGRVVEVPDQIIEHE